MINFNQTEVILNIQQLIDKHRCSVDGFFTDSKSAAKEIWKYLEREKIILKNEEIFEMQLNGSKAA